LRRSEGHRTAREAGLLRVARVAVAAGALFATMVAAQAQSQSPGEAARALLRSYNDDPAGIDRARDLLESAVARDGAADPATLVTLSRAWFLFAENRARTREARLAAFERGSAVAERAIAEAPGNAEAHLWYAIHIGSRAQAQGLLRSLLTLRTLRREVDTVLRLDPDNIEGHIMAGSLHRELPAALGGDRAEAERHFKTARMLDPHLTGVRIELARLYLNTGRVAEARQELQGVLDETAPTDRPRWTLKEAPRARMMLESLRDKP
jgi:tetratricopeptide repeat protein